ncbi:MAG: carboxypeptidase regulatory-like domain-containing protein [bacterium]
MSLTNIQGTAFAKTGSNHALSPAAGAAIEGKVTFAGAVPAKKKITVNKDVSVCGKVDHYNEDLVVAKDKGLANVVVGISGVKGGKSFETWGDEFVLDQNGCLFQPHVLLAPVGAKIQIKNSDGILHNIHTFSEKNTPINKAQPKFLKVLKISFDKPEFIRVACDVHNWMNSYVAIVDNPYYAITDENGKFSLADVPPGSYTLEFWHEKLGTQTQKVTVKAGATATVNMEFAESK